MTEAQNRKFHYFNDKPEIIFKEYGRNIQQIVRWISEEPDKERRTKLCYAVIDLIRKLNPSVLNDSTEDQQKIWDHLTIMSGFKLDVESPYPMPEVSILNRKPERIPYPKPAQAKLKHYGHNLDLMIEKAIALEDPEEKEAAVVFIGRMMKGFYSAWNKDTLDDATVIKQLEDMSGGKLSIAIEKVQELNLFDIPKEWKQGGFPNDAPSGGKNYKNYGHSANKKKGKKR